MVTEAATFWLNKLCFMSRTYPRRGACVHIEPSSQQAHFLCMGSLTSAQGRSLRAKRAGQMRAVFWRSQGFPNLVLARAVKATKRLQELARAKEEEFRIVAEKRANEIATNLEVLRRSSRQKAMSS
jgi:hypothetical protein